MSDTVLPTRPIAGIEAAQQQTPRPQPPQQQAPRRGTRLIVPEVSGGYIAVAFHDGQAGSQAVAINGDGLADLARSWAAG